MSAFQNILSPIDFSPFARRALDHALALARVEGSRLTVLYVAPSVSTVVAAIESPFLLPTLYAQDDLDRFRDDVRRFVEESATDVPVVCEVVEGHPAQVIAALAADRGADLVVMGTHGRTGFDRLVLGSVTERVLRQAPCSVLVVTRPRDAAAAPSVFSRILCAVDFSPASMKAIEVSQRIATAHHARVSLVHAVERPSPYDPVMAGVLAASGEPGSSPAVSARTRLSALAEAMPGGAEAIVSEGKPYRAVLDAAEERRADLIVVGAHGGPLGAYAFGSTTNQIVRQATCPVLVAR